MTDVAGATQGCVIQLDPHPHLTSGLGAKLMAIGLHACPLIHNPCHGQSLGARVTSRNSVVEYVGQSSGPGMTAASWLGFSQSHRSLWLTPVHLSEHKTVRFTVSGICKKKVEGSSLVETASFPGPVLFQVTLPWL